MKDIAFYEVNQIVIERLASLGWCTRDEAYQRIEELLWVRDRLKSVASIELVKEVKSENPF